MLVEGHHAGVLVDEVLDVVTGALTAPGPGEVPEAPPFVKGALAGGEWLLDLRALTEAGRGGGDG